MCFCLAKNLAQLSFLTRLSITKVWFKVDCKRQVLGKMQNSTVCPYLFLCWCLTLLQINPDAQWHFWFNEYPKPPSGTSQSSPSWSNCLQIGCPWTFAQQKPASHFGLSLLHLPPSVPLGLATRQCPKTHSIPLQHILSLRHFCISSWHAWQKPLCLWQ